MRAMKDSGVKWIGEIPVDWDIAPLKRWLASRDGGAWGDVEQGTDGDLVCIRVADFDHPRLSIKKDGEFTTRHYNKNIIDRLVLTEGDILVEKSGGGEKTPVGRAIMFMGSYPALFANFMDRLRIADEYDSRFFLYVWTSLYQSGHVIPFIKQTTGIQNLNITSFLSSVAAPNPEVIEQERITTFLDAKCAQIDAIIEKQQQVIEKLKEYKQSVITEAVTKGLDPTVPMKDSGVEWIGKVPEKWIVSKLGNVATIQTGNTPSKNDNTKYYSDRGTPWIKPDNLMNLQPTIETKEYLNVNGSKLARLVPAETVLVCCIGSIGKVGFTAIESGFNQQINAVQFDFGKVYWKYGLYYLLTQEEQHWYYANGNVLKILNARNQAKLSIPIPPRNTQFAITQYLDTKCKSIDTAIAKKETIITKLTAYKKSLIYEAVTGKMEV